MRDAIVDYLRTQARPIAVARIEQAVSESLDHDVGSSSIRSYLRLNTPGTFKRVSRGQYSLAKSSGSLSRHKQAEQTSKFPAFRTGLTTLFNADTFEWIETQAADSYHAIVTDPPYGLVEYSAKEQAKLRAGSGGVWRIPPSFDGHIRSPLPRFTTLDDGDLDNLRRFFARFGRAALRILMPGSHVLVASNPLVSYIVANELVNAGFDRRGEIIRLVMTMRGGDRPKNAHHEFSDVSVMPRSMWEPWLLFRKPLEGRVQDNLRKWGTGGLRRISKEKPFGDVIKSSPTQATEKKLAPHPSLKPQAFLRQVVRAMLPLGQGVILDPFAGSGSTLAACEATGYRSVGVELDTNYYGLAQQAIPRLARYQREVSSGFLYNQDSRNL